MKKENLNEVTFSYDKLKISVKGGDSTMLVLMLAATFLLLGVAAIYKIVN